MKKGRILIKANIAKLKPELLAPAGNLEKLRFAVAYGADAVYLAGENFGLRAAADNFSLAEMAEAIKYGQQNGVSVYVAVNVFAHNRDFDNLTAYLEALRDLAPAGLIVSDLGVFSLAKEIAPRLPLHTSTQANTVNWRAAGAWQAMGAKRVVLGRELSLSEISGIAEKTAQTGVELEMFIHGAMCMSYSGRCLLSNYLTGRDANQGACTHPCRWQYRLVEEKRPGEYLPIEEDERGSYIMNAKDLCLLPYLPQIIAAGVHSLKIEGRMKSAYYTAAVTKVYREAVDTIAESPRDFEEKVPQWLAELEKVSHRDYCSGFLMGPPGREAHNYNSGVYAPNYDFVGIVLAYDQEKQALLVEQRNHFACGETLELLPPRGTCQTYTLRTLLDEDFTPIQTAPHPQMKVYIPFAEAVPAMTILRRRR